MKINLSKNVILAFFCLSLLFVSVSFADTSQEADIWMPSNPLKGRAVFDQKNCSRCHAVTGSGGKIGPDLSESSFNGGFLDLGATLWNHTPDMLVEYKSLNLPWPHFSDDDVRNLISFLYYLDYLGQPGNSARGEQLYKEKACYQCHNTGYGKKPAPSLDSLTKYVSPLFLAQSIWNHEPRMQNMMREKKIPVPTLDGQDISDLSAYIRTVSRKSTREKIYLSPGNPNEGKKIFQEKACVKCHSIRGKGGSLTSILDKGDLKKSAAHIAARMWNHGTRMREEMLELGLTWPTFTQNEMADLVAYLYFLKFNDPPGDARRGKQLFESKQCLSCHSINKVGGNLGPDLAKKSSFSSHVAILTAMLNHSNRMSEAFLEKGKPWPRMQGSELRDIYSYLMQSAKKFGE